MIHFLIDELNDGEHELLAAKLIAASVAQAVIADTVWTFGDELDTDYPFRERMTDCQGGNYGTVDWHTSCAMSDALHKISTTGQAHIETSRELRELTTW